MILTSGLPAATMIREGHRGLLATVREFASDFHDTRGSLAEPDELRAMIAFLRQGLLPFAHWEEKHLDGCDLVTEDTAFEHAFLSAEVDALAAAVADLEQGDEESRRGIARRVRRHVHRLEALLELHVQKAEDREGILSAPEPASAESVREVPGGVREMTPAEVHRFLREQKWGILCTVGQGFPYGVPVSYGFDGEFLYVASGPGRKRRHLEANGAVCLTVAQVADGDRWSSVVATGEAFPIDGLRGNLHALRVMRRGRAGGAPPSAADLARIARASIFRITTNEVTGRTRG